MKDNYAEFDTKKASLDTEFGYAKAMEWFGEEYINALPKYVRGPKKGMPKGFIVWKKVVRGGWVKTFGGGYVENRVNTIIERKLHKMESSQHGNFPGEMIADKESIDRAIEARKTRLSMLDERFRDESLQLSTVEAMIIEEQSPEKLVLLRSVAKTLERNISKRVGEIIEVQSRM